MNTLKAGPSGREAIKFTKMHGLGNDYVYVRLDECPWLQAASEHELSELARKISHRHFGLGADGLVLIARLGDDRFRMRMWNADGSEAQMCGNASRCVGKLVFDAGLTSSTLLYLDTLAGQKTLHLHIEQGVVASVTVDMGEPQLSAPLIPVIPSNPSEPVPSVTVMSPVGPLTFTAVSMGNPHGVCFVDKVTDELVLGFGPRMEINKAWPEKANIEFAHVISPTLIEMRVWERGTGETLACGTGACATAVAAHLRGLAGRCSNVKLPGGTLQIDWRESDSHVLMTGPATTVAQGFYFP